MTNPSALYINQQLFNPFDLEAFSEPFSEACVDAFFDIYDDVDCRDFTYAFMGS
jgi:hypothetical protein